MRHGGALIGLAGALGVGIFLAIFFLLPKPGDLDVPYFLNVHLPTAPDRTTPLPDPDAKTGVTITFVGDIMLARAVERSIAENGTSWPFAKLGDVLAGSDMVVGNLEGTVRANRNLEVVNQMVFDTTPDNVAMLADTGFTHLSLANNHADDYGSQVTLDTRQTVIDNGMTPFGDPSQSELFVARENINGVSLSLIGFHAFGETTTEILEAIEAEDAQGRFVIVYPHWGPEYIEIAPAAETDPAAQFIKAGADLIVGAHPHVIQNVEVIEGVPVIYSLGNFLFDQDFSAETMRGLTVQAEITEDNIELDFTPVVIENRQTSPMEDLAAQALFSELNLPDGRLSVARE
jgi:poly-gamma-glutamate synthesis protein (capsule biosynthesis protein)